jgi:hypothetical protein
MDEMVKAGIIVIISLSAVGIIAFVVPALGVTTTTTTVDNSNRREYVYCPIDSLLLNSKTTYEIDGCPTVRLYVNNWNNLATTDKTAVDTQLRSAGFKDVGEVLTK